METSEGLVDAATRTFTIGLKSGLAWTLMAGIRRTSNGTAVMQSDPFNTVITAQNPTINTSFIIKPLASGSGNVSLTLNASAQVSRAVITCDDEIFPKTELAFSGGTATLALTGIPSGAHDITISFYDATGERLYVTRQAINVFPSLTTDRWLSGGGGLIGTDGKFELTDALITEAAQKIFYVGDPGTGAVASDTNSGGAYEPLSTVARALELVAQARAGSTNYTIYVCGTQTRTHEITTTGIASLTISGKYGGGTLDGNGAGTTLKINTAVPVTLKDITITGGSAEKGGGILVEAGASLTVAGGTKITGNTANYGGGIHNGGTLLMTGGEVSGNTAARGGAVNNEGTLSIGAGAWLPGGDDEANPQTVRLANGTTVEIGSALTHESGVAVLEPETAGADVQVLSGDDALLATEHGKFTVRVGNGRTDCTARVHRKRGDGVPVHAHGQEGRRDHGEPHPELREPHRAHPGGNPRGHGQLGLCACGGKGRHDLFWLA